MGNQEQLNKLLHEGVQVWNQWRDENPGIHIDLGIDSLIKANLTDANLSGADLTGAIFTDANLTNANLRFATLGSAGFTNALQLHFKTERSSPSERSK
jgi:Pentapeptide repeats (8 copies)